VDKPKTPAGSDTYPLDALAALSADRKLLTVAIVNPSESEQQINVAFQGATLRDNGRAGKLWRISSNDLTAANVPGQPPVVDIMQSTLTGPAAQLTLPKFSISVYEWPVQ
jgi:alpha-N-arabinofuranosidase